jgi:hypothetical protein
LKDRDEQFVVVHGRDGIVEKFLADEIVSRVGF